MKIALAFKGRYHIRDAVVIEYISAIAKRHGHQAALIYDQDIFGITDNVISIPFLNKIFSHADGIIKKGKEENPRLAIFLDGFNRSQWNAEISQGLKRINNNLITVLFSCWPPVSPVDAYDYVLIGEPESAAEKFFAQNIFEADKGVYEFKELAEVNDLPLPDKTLFAPYVNFRDSYMVYTGRGCPYGCSYCEETMYKHALGEAYFRRRNPQDVIQELEAAKKNFAIKEVIYKDSVFAWDKEWLKAYLGMYRRQINLPYKCFAKAEVFDNEICLMLKESGCYCLEFGVQTFNQQIKEDILERNEKTSVLGRAFSICERHALRFDADHMFGIPGERIEDHIEAAKTYLPLRYLNRIKCHNLVYYPRAKIYRYAPKWVKEKKDYRADFFSAVSGQKDMLKVNRIFTKYFKVLPLFTKRINLFILEKRLWKVFAYIPNLLIIFLMLILAIKNHDRRFSIYANLYPRKIMLALRGA